MEQGKVTQVTVPTKRSWPLAVGLTLVALGGGLLLLVLAFVWYQIGHYSINESYSLPLSIACIIAGALLAIGFIVLGKPMETEKTILAQK